MSKKVAVGCSSCPYAGHLEKLECPDAYTEKARYCKMYDSRTFGDRADEVDEDDIQSD